MSSGLRLIRFRDSKTNPLQEFLQSTPYVQCRSLVNPRKLEHGCRMINARIPFLLYLKGIRTIMFQLSGFYYVGSQIEGSTSGSQSFRVQGFGDLLLRSFWGFWALAVFGQPHKFKTMKPETLNPTLNHKL